MTTEMPPVGGTTKDPVPGTSWKPTQALFLLTHIGEIEASPVGKIDVAAATDGSLVVQVEDGRRFILKAVDAIGNLVDALMSEGDDIGVAR